MVLVSVVVVVVVVVVVDYDIVAIFLTFKERCRMPIGNSGVGSVVSHSLKSGWGFEIRSRTFSRSLSHLTSK